jgi:hypothetical protein
VQARNCAERIANLKKWRMDNGKTVDECVELFDGVPSVSTIKKVLGKGSEAKSFRESTIAAMELKMMGHVYSPQIAIPVEDVIRAQEAVVRPLVEASKVKSEEIKLRDRLIAVLLLFDVAILIFDLSIKTGGFFNSKTLVVWVIEVVVVLTVAFILFIYKKRKKGAPE